MLCLSLSPVTGWAADPLVWHVSHFPPANILSGEFEGQGFADKTRKFFQARLSDYRHETQNVGYGASMTAAADGVTFCRADLLKTPEREKIFHYSRPTYFMSGRRLIVDNEIFSQVRDYTNKNGDVRFYDVLQQPWAKFAFVKGRAYFADEKQKLVAYQNAYADLGTESSKQAYDRFYAKEANLLILYPFEYYYYLRSQKQTSKSRSLQVMDMTPFAFGYFACTKNAAGQKVIDQINQVIDHETGMYQWLDFYKEWVSEDEWRRVKRAFHKAFASTD